MITGTWNENAGYFELTLKQARKLITGSMPVFGREKLVEQENGERFWVGQHVYYDIHKNARRIMWRLMRAGDSDQRPEHKTKWVFPLDLRV